MNTKQHYSSVAEQHQCFSNVELCSTELRCWDLPFSFHVWL